MSSPYEIERKFKVHVDKLPPLEGGTPMVQGYLAKGPSVRVRITEDILHEAWITIKGKGAVKRLEFEYKIPVPDAYKLLDMCRHSLRKIRHVIEYEGHTWEVDQFTHEHQGLWLAELELGSENEEFSVPPWVADEVTYDGRYTNAALAEAGKAPKAY